MMFNKAGRPKKNTAAETGLNKPWTQQELTVINDSVRALAFAVVQQWKLDGCLEDAANEIQPWIKILESLEEEDE